MIITAIHNNNDIPTPPQLWHTKRLSELSKMEFGEFSWLFHNLIPAVGVTLLCGKPKIGKSWFAYDLAIGTAIGRITFGRQPLVCGDVLYLALEDSERRLKFRGERLIPGMIDGLPSNIEFSLEWSRLDKGGLEHIQDWITTNRAAGGNPKLIVIDVLASIRKPVANQNMYEADYYALKDITKLAHQENIAIVVVHHIRKMKADDPMETIYGSYGLSGAVDTLLVLASKDLLDVRGRDVESQQFAIDWDKNDFRWSILGDAGTVLVSEQQKRVLNVLTNKPQSISDIAKLCGLDKATATTQLNRLYQDEAITKSERGAQYSKKIAPTNGAVGRPNGDGSSLKAHL